MNACELTASITAIANALACNLTEDELNLLGAALTQLRHPDYHCDPKEHLQS